MRYLVTTNIARNVEGTPNALMVKGYVSAIQECSQGENKGKRNVAHGSISQHYHPIEPIVYFFLSEGYT